MDAGRTPRRVGDGKMITRADIKMLDTTGLEEPIILDDDRVVFGPAYMLEICDQWDLFLLAGSGTFDAEKITFLRANVEGFRRAIIRMRDQVRADIEDRAALDAAKGEWK